METPITKVGVCAVIKHENAPAEILLVQPNGKDPSQAGAPPFVLPRGTRAYVDESGELIDARTVADAIAHADALEPLDDTMKREALEEAGIPPSLFATGNYKTLGARIYQSVNKPPYPIHWGVLELKPEDKAKLTLPQDSQAVQWVTLERFDALVKDGTARAGYLDIAREALDLLAQGKGGNGR